MKNMLLLFQMWNFFKHFNKNIIIHENYFGIFQHLNYSRSSDSADFCSKIKYLCYVKRVWNHTVWIFIYYNYFSKHKHEPQKHTVFYYKNLMYIRDQKKFKKSHCYEIALFDSVYSRSHCKSPLSYLTQKSLLNRTIHRLSLFRNNTLAWNDLIK